MLLSKILFYKIVVYPFSFARIKNDHLYNNSGTCNQAHINQTHALVVVVVVVGGGVVVVVVVGGGGVVVVVVVDIG